MSKLNKKQIEEMNDKLISRCPHCSDMIGATNSSQALLYKNEFDKFNRILELLEKISSSLDTLVERGNA